MAPGGLFDHNSWGFVIAGAVAGMVGFADILNRYEGNPWRAARYMAAILFMFFNVVFGVIAYWFAFVLGVSGAIAGESGEVLPRTVVIGGLASGFLAVVILRTTTFNLGGASDNGGGPKVIVDALLSACDQSIDRALAADKDRAIRKMMMGLDYDDAKVFLPAYCLSLLEQATTDLAQAVAQQSKSIDDTPVTQQMKAFLLGCALIKFFGFANTSKAVRSYRLIIATPAPLLPATPPTPPAPTPVAPPPVVPAPGQPPAPPAP